MDVIETLDDLKAELEQFRRNLPDLFNKQDELAEKAKDLYNTFQDVAGKIIKKPCQLSESEDWKHLSTEHSNKPIDYDELLRSALIEAHKLVKGSDIRFSPKVVKLLALDAALENKILAVSELHWRTNRKERIWSNELSWARNNLKDQGVLDARVRGKWSLFPEPRCKEGQEVSKELAEGIMSPRGETSENDNNEDVKNTAQSSPTIKWPSVGPAARDVTVGTYEAFARLVIFVWNEPGDSLNKDIVSEYKSLLERDSELKLWEAFELNETDRSKLEGILSGEFEKFANKQKCDPSGSDIPFGEGDKNEPIDYLRMLFPSRRDRWLGESSLFREELEWKMLDYLTKTKQEDDGGQQQDDDERPRLRARDFDPVEGKTRWRHELGIALESFSSLGYVDSEEAEGDMRLIFVDAEI